MRSKNRICGYYRRGFTMSRNGRRALLHDEFPIGYFTHLFKLDETAAVPLLIYMGNHHTGMYGDLTRFYRLPDKDDVDELGKVFDAFHSIAATEITFIEVMSLHLQKRIDERDKKIPKNKMPRKRTKRRCRNKRRARQKRSRARKRIIKSRFKKRSNASAI